MSVVEFDHFPIDGAALLAGAAAALLVVRAEDAVKRPTLKHLGWRVSPEPHHYWGHFYYFRFRVDGRFVPGWSHDPGPCRIRLRWPRGGSFAKWEELAEPGWYLDDGRFWFQASMVPSTFYLPLTPGIVYEVPLLAQRPSRELWVHSGWSYGWDRGFGDDPRVRPEDRLEVDFQGGGGLRWRRHIRIGTILLGKGAGRLPRVSKEPADYFGQRQQRRLGLSGSAAAEGPTP